MTSCTPNNLILMDKMSFGRIGEYVAEKFLIANNYKILQKNVYFREGELDIVAFEIITQEIVFVEVKTRSSNLFGEPEESVTHEKKIKILKAAIKFLNLAREIRHKSWRIDVIAVKLTKERKFLGLKHFKNILNE
ncbi:YraN family protein [Candidatus Peregrinibacteria bacterium CG_4_10_14_0_2_um_filter_38_24]|nr:MAG: YraN family protein [Candidatus Peregrinibacteria bacterium CG_4_10_14_0_2_um_filter_38_24]PJC38854.1 MAG: YraN family protein [Candidatus Peregrinibacteria bacterium CG_4_9_14_0_2_um_filter_38_9]